MQTETPLAAHVANKRAEAHTLSVAQMAKTLCCLAPLALVITRPMLAARHPVQLAPNTDAAKCLECHEDKAKGKAVHSAMKMGCLSCHEVRVSKEATHVKLITATPSALCFTCHSDKNLSSIKGQVHPPAARDCLKCHDPHSSANKNQLVKLTSGGSAQENLCLSCHSVGVDAPKGGSRHAALDMGCETCHVIHKTGDPAQREFAGHLTKSTPQLCLDCHDVNGEEIRKAHQNQPLGAADCIECHDPHQSKSPKLMQAFLHNPFENKTCDTCHQSANNGKVVLTAADSKAVCLTCHEEQAKQIASAKVRHPGAQGDCTVCHNPHAGKTPGFLQPNPVAACLSCHSEQAEQFKKSHLHQPAYAQGCATCHEPHGGDNAHLLRAKNVNALCLECHGPDASPQKLASEHLVAIFDGKVRLPENYLNKVPILPLKYGLGHPTENHPVSDVLNAKTKTQIAMNCLTCHQPHSGNQPGMLVKDQKNDMNFCSTCHTNGSNLLDVQVGGN
jgi:predicted CXXCH cytochrome family protein